MLEKHPVWQYALKTETLQEFKENVLKPIYINPALPEDIQSEIKLVEKLLIHSFFEYEFVDVALTHAVFTLEKALKIKNKEIGAGLKPRLVFEKLIEWFFTNGYFETDNIEVPNQLRSIRNDKVHKEEKSLGGMVFIAKVYHALDLINDLYEDRNLRIERKQIRKSLNENLREFIKGGIILNTGIERLIVYNAYFIFIDNKGDDIIYHIGFSPIFNLKPYQEDRHPIPPSIILSVTDLNISENQIIAKSQGKEIRIDKMDEKNRQKFETWKTELFSIREHLMILSIATNPWEKYYQRCLREFQKKQLAKLP